MKKLKLRVEDDPDTRKEIQRLMDDLWLDYLETETQILGLRGPDGERTLEKSVTFAALITRDEAEELEAKLWGVSGQKTRFSYRIKYEGLDDYKGYFLK